jgi:hypothetical protein
MAVLHLTVTIGSSTIRVTHTLKWVRKSPSLQLSGTIYVRPLAVHLGIFVALNILCCIMHQYLPPISPI